MHSRPREHSGAALIIVVAFLVLLSGLIIAFYSRVGTDLANSRSFAEGVSARQLADSAVGVVMGQIREATTVKQGAWASQPGMIRVYGTGNGPSANAFGFYKLYSSHDLIVSAKELQHFDPTQFDQASVAAALEVPLGRGGWRDQPAYFTDLNEPATVPVTTRRKGQLAKTKRYPIFDPGVAAVHEPAVADPSKFERPWLVEGSAIALPRHLREADKDPAANPAPMPVRWIYVLRDGTLTAPTPLDRPASNLEGAIAHWKALSGGKHGVPTKTNPIVGRIAFWADDDTAKVNINTAGGFVAPPGMDEDLNTKAAMDYAGSFWDTPRVNSLFDRGSHKGTDGEPSQIDVPGLANTQPAQNEFQRYPGHPATTSLDVVFKRLLRDQGHVAARAFNSEVLYTWLPRLTPGGSRGGTKRLDTAIDRELPIKSATDMLDYPAYPNLNGKTFHLFGAVDEMLFTPENGPRRPAEEFLDLPPGTITAELLDRARFFLTAHSRAPELNLFGKPRVSIWPIWDEPFNASLETSRSNPSDALIRFCSRIGGRDFIFTRKNAYSATADFNLKRNRALLEYLRRLTSRTEGVIPGFGGSFEEKLQNAPGGRDQLLTQIFDYIRTVNLKDTTRLKDINESGKSRQEQEAERDRYMYAPRGLVVPTRAELGGKKVAGFGRFPTISEATIVFYHGGWVGRSKTGKDQSEVLIQDPDELPKHNVTHKLVRAFLIFETFNPMQGYAPTSNLEGTQRLVHELKLPNDFTIRSQTMASPASLGFKSKASNQITLSSGETWGGRGFGGTEGFFHTMADKFERDLWPTSSWEDPKKDYPRFQYAFRTQADSVGGGNVDGVRVPLADETFSFSGGKAELAIRFNDQVVQTIHLNFPPGQNWLLPRGLSAKEQARILLPGEIGGALWEDRGGFAKATDLLTPVPRYPVRREWFHSIERRAAWMMLSKANKRDHSLDPWPIADGGDGRSYQNRWRNILQPGDTVRSLILGKSDRPDQTDPRALAIQTVAEASFFPHPDYHTSSPRAETLRRGDGAYYFESPPGALLELPRGKNYSRNKAPDLPAGLIAKRQDGKAADFDTGIGNYPDGGYSGKPDEGNVLTKLFDPQQQKWVHVEPYFNTGAEDHPPMDTFFSPSRQIPSAVMFGSLLSSGRGWETLAFSPHPAGENHPGLKSPRDHLLLDLFTMPVVEPYAISEPFSTAGKVNLNYQIMPFGYLKRSTALRAALQSVRVTAIPQANAPEYKYDLREGETPKMPNARYLVDRDETLRAFEEFFAEYKTDRNRGFFKSATEICDRFLYPKGETHVGKIPYRAKGEAPIRQSFWANSALTGDNVREKPYADLYPRLTTKSNTYTVHYRVQTLRQRPPAAGEDEAAHYAKWDESRDGVLSELRGHTTIERYLDPEDKRFSPAYNGEQLDVEKQSLEDAYRFRIIYHKRFSPW